MSGTKLLAQPDDSRFLADKPLTISRPSRGRLPCTEKTVMFMLPVPPTSCWLPPLKLVSVTPGTRTATAYWLRPPGSADTTSSLIHGAALRVLDVHGRRFTGHRHGFRDVPTVSSALMSWYRATSTGCRRV
jgi:hypothetical protein